jgi:uncharacterized protein
MFSFFPKDGVFYQLFEKQARILEESAVLLKEVLDEKCDINVTSLRLKELETEADSIGHEVMDTLRKNFITPMEGEDIDLLRQYLDDTIDYIERSANRLVIYKIRRPYTDEIRDYINIICEAVGQIREGVKEIKNVKKFQENLHRRCEKLNNLENAGDEVNRRALGGLMNMPDIDCQKLVEIIKLKEIYETLENAIDCCENVGNMFESIMIKNQ